MPTTRPRHRLTPLGTAGAVASLALSGLLAVPATATTPAPSAGTGTPGSTAPPAVADVDAAELIETTEPRPDGRVTAFVEVAQPSALAVRDARGQTAAADRAVDAQVQRTEAVGEAVAKSVSADDDGAEVLYTTAYTVPGVTVSADPEALVALLEREDVVTVTPVVRKTVVEPAASDEPAAIGADILTRAVDTWQQTGATGRDVRIAVIDTGLDYTHAAFGGPGTPEASRAALASTTAPTEGSYDPTKYLGGHDFAGATYNPSGVGAAFDPVPRPDANPVDGATSGHGTHVTGSAAGFGVTTEGETLRTDYTTVTADDVRELAIGPGSAPDAAVYALKVFGDRAGSTDLTGAALDWVGKAIAEGERIDVVNLSLGTDFGAQDDPDNAKIDALVDQGVLPVMAAGNAGDAVDVAGSPGNAVRGLAVAASASGRGLLDGVSATAPADVAGTGYAGQFSLGYTRPFAVTAPVALPSADNATGCQPFSTADRARLQGKIVWLAWDEASLGCNSAVRFQNATEAQAAGVVLPSDRDVFESGIAGNFFTPGVQLDAASTRALRPAAEAGTLVLTLDSARRGTIPRDDASSRDTVAGFTSRGVHGSVDGVVKPDVSAPGVNIVAARTASGTGTATLSGTSMASPHVAGIAALVVQTQPTWGPDRVKEAIMTTAVHDVTTRGADPVVLGHLRAGTGRVDALAATTATASVASVDRPGLVTGSFGVVDVAGEPLRQEHRLVVRNDGTEETTFAVEQVERRAMPGVRFEVGPELVTVPAGGEAELTATLVVEDPEQVRRVLDPASAAVVGGQVRNFVSDAQATVSLRPTSGDHPPLRVSLFAAPRLVGSTEVAPVTFGAGALSTTAQVQGRGVDQGDAAGGVRSTVVPLQMGATDPAEDALDLGMPVTQASLDVVAVGAVSTAPQLEDPSDGVLAIGVQVAGEWPRLSPHHALSAVIDVDGDSRPDFVTRTAQFQGTPDRTMSVTQDLFTGVLVDVRPVGSSDSTGQDTVHDSDVVVLPVALDALGFTEDTTAGEISYQVSTSSGAALGLPGAGATGVVDEVASVDFDVYTPDLWFGAEGASGEGELFFAGTPGELPVHREPGTAGTDALVLHLLNAAGQRGQVVTTSVTDPVLPLLDGTAELRCTARGAELVVAVTNGADVPVSLRITSAVGSTRVTQVAPGERVERVVRARSVPARAGLVEITATERTSSARPARHVEQVRLPAASCD